MTTRREYAISKGLATPGRGRMSREAHAAIEKAELDGMVFTDPKPVTKADKIATREAARPAPRKTVVQTPVQENDTLVSKPFTGKFEAKMPGGKRKAVSERTACTCGASLCYCLCSPPTVPLLIVDPGADDVDAVVEIAKV
jgi:hypothetical protein